MLRVIQQRTAPSASRPLWQCRRTTAAAVGSSTLTTTTTRLSSSTSSFNNSSSNNNRPRPALRKVLVANRGEIACRVIRTCQRLEIPTVALYSVADGPNALHAQMADEAYLIGDGPTPAESYLRQEDIVRIAHTTGAQAIHPGYGFLSENAQFSSLIEKNNLTFVGPPKSAIQAMGSKSESKAIMDAAGVPTTPGFYETFDDNNNEPQPQDVEMLRSRAVEIGFPVLIKAVMGGGGKGMRLVWNESEFLSSLESCQREAKAAFGDDRVLLEKYLVQPRHIEVQIVADTHGNVVSLYERDCSLQRRHQKIIEEAPASDLPHDLRQQFGEMGRKAAQAVGYVNAGTVEFLLDTQHGKSGDDGSSSPFYFCEMNTRLQVEHPVTEAITGQDLVEWQLRVAAGETLPITNSNDIPCVGHSFEARIYAEQPTRNFLPATGHVWHHAPPVTKLNTPFEESNASALTQQQRVRVDTCIQAGHDVSVYYDPMISKLIVHGDDRGKALDTLINALRNYQIAGVPTNIDFLIQCADHETFRRAGAVNTGFLDDYANDLNLDEEALKKQLAPPLAQAVAGFASMLYMEQRDGSPMEKAQPTHPWSTQQGSWRLGGEAARSRRKLNLSGMDSSIECVSNPDGSFDIHVPVDAADSTDQEETQTFHIDGGMVNQNSAEMHVRINHTATIKLTCVLREDITKGKLTIKMWPKNLAPSDYAWEVTLDHPMARQTLLAGAGGSVAGQGASSGQASSPMPGKISRVNFQVGDSVSEGDVVVVMEAMKMEHSIKATMDGVLTELNCKLDDIVGDDAPLFSIGEADPEPMEEEEEDDEKQEAQSA